ncbi:MAG TPA: hypothetical protein VFA46_15440 [Actinomycetes bacterium]|nr:hypothetical protein [Actinomycetes bacterium]
MGPPGLRLELYLLSHPDATQRVLASSWRNYRKDNVFYSEVRGAFGDGVLPVMMATGSARCASRYAWFPFGGGPRA